MSEESKKIIPFSEKGKEEHLPAQVVMDNRRRFETPGREITLSEVHDYYKTVGDHLVRQDAPPASALLPILSATASKLPSLLSKYNTLEGMRRKSGYNKTMEAINGEILQILSFDKGFEKLTEAQKKYDPDYRAIEMTKMYYGGQLKQGDEEEIARELANSLTSEEITWISGIAKIPALLFQHQLSTVPAIVDYFYDGVEWGLDTLDYREKDGARDTYEIVGVTGARDDTVFTPFEPKLTLAMKGIYFGVLGDAHVFDRCFENLASAAFVSGDKKILQIFATRDGVAFDDAYARSARDKVSEYLRGIHIVHMLNGQVLTVQESVQFIGMLESMPDFFFSRQVLSFVPCGKGVMFLEPGDLSEVGYVPFDPYVAHVAQTEVYNGSNAINRENPVWNFIFDTLRKKLRERNEIEKKYSALEELANKLKTEYGITARISVEKFTTERIFRLLGKNRVDYSVKMGFYDLFCLENTLSKIPKKYLTGTKVVERLKDGDIYDEMMSGAMHAGTFNRRTRTMSLVIAPIKSDDQLGISEVHYALTVAHEIGHSIYHIFRKAWKRLSKAGALFPPDKRAPEFLTAYASVSHEEDFCETFACYLVFGDEFRTKADAHPAIKCKYQLMKQIFDGTEFQQQVPHTSEDVIGVLSFDFNARLRALDAKDDQEAFAKLLERRKELEAMKAANQPVLGPEVCSFERRNEKNKPELHLPTWVDPAMTLKRILRQHLGKLAKHVHAGDLADWLYQGCVNEAVGDVANHTGLKADQVSSAVEKCYEALKFLEAQVAAADRAIEEEDKRSEIKEKDGDDGPVPAYDDEGEEEEESDDDLEEWEMYDPEP